MFQIYIPLTLIVCCSWITFLLVKTEKGSEIPARTSLGATTVLSVVTIGFGGKTKPQVIKMFNPRKHAAQNTPSLRTPGLDVFILKPSNSGWLCNGFRCFHNDVFRHCIRCTY